MHYILFMILLTTAPGQSTPKPKRLYTVQTTQAIEFDTLEACKFAHDDIERSISQTDTVVMVSACYRKGGGESPVTADKPATDKSVSGDSPERTPAPERVFRFKTFKGQ